MTRFLILLIWFYLVGMAGCRSFDLKGSIALQYTLEPPQQVNYPENHPGPS